MPKRILFISNLFPNPLNPTMAPYNRQQVVALSDECEVEVISPIPWPLLMKHPLKERVRSEGGVTVHHPTYYYLPGAFRNWHGDCFYLSIRKTASRLLETGAFDLIYSSWLYPDSWAAAKLAGEFGLPLYVKVHGSDVNRLTEGTSMTRRSLSVARTAQKIFCVSAALKERLAELGVPKERLEVIYNGIDRNIFFPGDKNEIRRLLRIQPDQYIVLYVGNLKKDKGVAELLHAFQAVLENGAAASPGLVLIGSGPYGKQAMETVCALGLGGKVTFLGTQSLEAIALWMNAASVLCLPSYMEGVPNVVLEALACGTRVVATSVGGIPELVRGGSLTLVPPRSVPELVAALIEAAVQHEPMERVDLVQSWQENARSLLRQFDAAG